MTERGTTQIIETLALGSVFIGAVIWACVFQRDPTLSKAALLGNALGPIATLVTAGALFVGFNSLRLQRDALKGQQDEITRTLKELARTADAQEQLAVAQRAATIAQHRANLVAVMTAMSHVLSLKVERPDQYPDGERAHARGQLADMMPLLSKFLNVEVEALKQVDASTGR